MKGSLTKVDALLLLTVLIGLAGVIGVSRLIEAQRTVPSVATPEEQLYLNGATVKRVSLGFNGLAAYLFSGSIFSDPEFHLFAHVGVHLAEVHPENKLT